MVASIRLLILALVLASLSACPESNGLKPAVPCTGDGECVGTGNNVCNLAAPSGGVCVQCLPMPGKKDACTGDTPACGADNTCRACQAHSECDSNVCLTDGKCAAETEVVYLERGGSIQGGAQCTLAQPCGLMSIAVGRAMTGTRPYIRVKGVIDYANVDIDGKTLTIFGDTSSVLRGAGGLGPGADDSLLDLSNGAKVSIYDLTLRDARREGIRVDDAASTLLLQRSKVIDMGEHGIVISNGGQASIIQSEISECQGGGRYGVNLTAGQVEISRSKIFDNSGGVFVADNQQFQITNSFIVENIALGGLRIQKPTADSKLAFNTIVDNRHNGNGSADAGGVICDDPAYTFGTNIIFRNTNNGTAGFLQTFGRCTYGNSLLSPNDVAEVRPLQFARDTQPRDYHLTSVSPAIAKDVAGVVCEGLVDFDGESRPQGGACDLGADEVK